MYPLLKLGFCSPSVLHFHVLDQEVLGAVPLVVWHESLLVCSLQCCLSVPWALHMLNVSAHFKCAVQHACHLELRLGFGVRQTRPYCLLLMTLTGRRREHHGII